MPDDLPQLSALRAFSHAARLLSFKAAAAALNLSPSALSRQIQSLEEHLGVAIFHRLNPGLELTHAGRLYRETVDRILIDLRSAQEDLRPRPSDALRVSALESFSAKWLIPNLPHFHKAKPGFKIEIEATLRYADFDRDPVDVAIRFGTGPWPGLVNQPLFDLKSFPVCSPDIVSGDSPLADPKDLIHHTLIHISQLPEAWKSWLAVAGEPNLEPANEVIYDHVGITLSAATSDQGIALSSKLLCQTELSDGRLIMPFEIESPSRETYHFVCREQSLSDPRVIAFRDWLVESLA